MALDWKQLGRALRESADDAHEGETPSVELAYQFMLDNPEMFSDLDEWPTGMPMFPPLELRESYEALK